MNLKRVYRCSRGDSGRESIWERVMSTAPAWVLDVLLFALTVGCIAAILFADPIYTRLRKPHDNPMMSTGIVSIAVALLVGAAWWFLVVRHASGR